MKLSINGALTALLVVAFAITALSAQKDPGSKEPAPQLKRTDWTSYYWFDADGNFLWRQNFVLDEIYFTGYDQMPNYPSTLQEKGYAPGACTGYPPSPFNPSSPAIRLYSHP